MVRGGPFDFLGGGGGVEENVPEQSIYFSLVRKQFFNFTMSAKKIVFLFLPKMRQIILVVIIANLRSTPGTSMLT